MLLFHDRSKMTNVKRVRFTTYFGIRLSSRLARRVTQAARANDQLVSEFIRSILRNAIEGTAGSRRGGALQASLDVERHTGQSATNSETGK